MNSDNLKINSVADRELEKILQFNPSYSNKFYIGMSTDRFIRLTFADQPEEKYTPNMLVQIGMTMDGIKSLYNFIGNFLNRNEELKPQFKIEPQEKEKLD